MSISIILAKLVGVVLFAGTVRSIIKHVKERKAKKQDQQAVSEQMLNNFLLYVWLAFMTVFSLGMIFNN
jgi:NADH:ubiquinone oxidoreductase subunit 6 (subunit J)